MAKWREPVQNVRIRETLFIKNGIIPQPLFKPGYSIEKIKRKSDTIVISYKKLVY